MKKRTLLTLLCLVVSLAGMAQKTVINVSTGKTDLLLQVGDNGRLYQGYLGEKLRQADYTMFSWNQKASSDGSVSKRGWEVYPCSGNEDYFDPALAIVHADGNRTTYLYYKSHTQKAIPGGTQTDIMLQDDKYPVEVTLHYAAYEKENVIKAWTEIRHQEKRPIRLDMYASSMLYFNCQKYFLTEFCGDWATEANMRSQQLQFGKKVIDTKLGSRAAMDVSPFFEVGLDKPASEHEGRVLMGTLGWTGNFRFTFEVDNVGYLRVISAINPYASDYLLKPGEVFRTPEFIFTLSQNGTGEGSRSLHNWARRYQVRNGQGSRMTLLNNWENTGFNFNQDMLADLMKEAKDLGVDLFLLDDGWFGNGENARNSDHAGLGDWEVNHEKLPGGIPALVSAAKDAGVKFGIWIEPEMVNPKSELYQKHPDWVIKQPNRDLYFFRNQLVLDLSNPKVQDYAFSVVERIMQENPDVAFFKWDCNSPITNIYSPYQKDRQGQLYIDHARGVNNVMRRVAEKYPNVELMLCSGGGARCDYEALKYFHEFWPSDDTDPVERLFIQWGFSQFFPAKTLCAHVTSWNRRASIKFRTDVASMCKLGFDIGLKSLSKDEIEYCRQAVSNWKRFSDCIMDGDQYRLVSPYDGNHVALNYVNQSRDKAILFAYDIHPRFNEKLLNVRMQGLDPDRLYRIEEINLMPGSKSRFAGNGQTYSGDFLMKVGLNVLTTGQLQSRVFQLIAQ